MTSLPFVVFTSHINCRPVGLCNLWYRTQCLGKRATAWKIWFYSCDVRKPLKPLDRIITHPLKRTTQSHFQYGFHFWV